MSSDQWDKKLHGWEVIYLCWVQYFSCNDILGTFLFTILGSHDKTHTLFTVFYFFTTTISTMILRFCKAKFIYVRIVKQRFGLLSYFTLICWSCSIFWLSAYPSFSFWIIPFEFCSKKRKFRSFQIWCSKYTILFYFYNLLKSFPMVTNLALNLA